MGRCGSYSLVAAARLFSNAVTNELQPTIALAETPQEVLDRLNKQGVRSSSETYASLLQQCTKSKALEQGRLVDEHIRRFHGHPARIIRNLLIDMYGKCGSLAEARAQFDQVRQRNAFTYNIMISAYAHNGHSQEALQLLREMDLDGIKTTIVTLVNGLSACSSLGNLAEGKTIHARILVGGHELDMVAMTALLNMYGKCGSLENARSVFNRMHRKDVVSWNAMITAYAQHGHFQQALELYQRMDPEGVLPDRVTFISTLTACSHMGAIEDGKSIHARIIFLGLETEDLGTTLINMYSRCGCLEDARRVFDRMQRKDLVTWNAMIAAYNQHECGKEALELYRKMDMEKLKPDSITFSSLLSACCSTGNLADGKLIHENIVASGYEQELGAALVNMYSKCGSLENASSMFGRTSKKDVIAWTSMIAAYAQHGYCEEAIGLYRNMDLEGEKLDEVAFVSVLDACAELAALEQAKMVHQRVIVSGFESDVVVGSALVNAYSKCWKLEDAKMVFSKMQWRNLVTWNAMIAGYIQHERLDETLDLYQKMMLDGMQPDKITFVLILDALSKDMSGAAGLIKPILACIDESGFSSNLVVGTALVNMHSRNGNLSHAKNTFNKMDERDVIAWNAMLGAYTQQAKGKEAMKTYQEMCHEGIKPDRVTFVTILESCMIISAVALGMTIHAQAAAAGYGSVNYTGTALVAMYGKCGNLELARKVFEGIAQKDVVSWTAMLAAYAGHGHGKQALELFREMQLDGIYPNEVTFVSILCACSHAGLHQKARQYFQSMIADYDIAPAADHYGSVIDLLGRAGRVDEAEDLVKSMPMEPVCLAWMTLLSACRIHGDVERGERAADSVVEFHAENPAPYVLISNIYASQTLKALLNLDLRTGSQPRWS